MLCLQNPGTLLLTCISSCRSYARGFEKKRWTRKVGLGSLAPMSIMDQMGRMDGVGFHLNPSAVCPNAADGRVGRQ